MTVVETLSLKELFEPHIPEEVHHWELLVEWKSDEPDTVIIFMPPDHDYDYAYDSFLLCVEAANGAVRDKKSKDATPAKKIYFSALYTDGVRSIIGSVAF